MYFAPKPLFTGSDSSTRGLRAELLNVVGGVGFHLLEHLVPGNIGQAAALQPKVQLGAEDRAGHRRRQVLDDFRRLLLRSFRREVELLELPPGGGKLLLRGRSGPGPRR